MIGNNLIAFVVTFAIALAWLRLNDFLAKRGWISSQLSRKIIHIGTGPIFVLCWILFKQGTAARYLAALVPLAITLQFALVGLGIIKDPAALAAISRSGNRKEILRGPLFYGIVFILLTVLIWYDNPIGMIALMMLCGGDGLADVAGNRIQSPRLPWSKGKSLAGSAAMFLGGWIFSVAITWFFTLFGIFAGSIVNYLGGITLIAIAATIVESLPLKDVDNLTIPAVAVLLGYFIF